MASHRMISSPLSWLLVSIWWRSESKILLRGTPTSWLALEAQPICALAASGDFSGAVQVFVHQDNTRHLEFGDEWSGTQTSVSCRGPMPTSCLAKFNEAGSPPSCDAVDCPCDRDASTVDTDYLAKMANVVVPLCKAAAESASFEILNIGLGGGDIPAYILAHCPTNTRIESIKYDPRVVTVAGKFFGTNDSQGRHKVDTGDGGAKAAELLKNGRSFDAVLIDVFDDAGDVPASCLGDGFTETVHGLLRPSGKVVQQVWDRQHSTLLESFKKEFGSQVEDGDGKHGQWVVVASKA